MTREWSDLFEPAERGREITAIGERLARLESEKSNLKQGWTGCSLLRRPWMAGLWQPAMWQSWFDRLRLVPLPC
jgi:hypothetical protein